MSGSNGQASEPPASLAGGNPVATSGPGSQDQGATISTTSTITPATASQAGPTRPEHRPDPVIQLLASKAATDPDLKALMRVVASGKASPEELKEFQGHIDELTPAANAIKAKLVEEDRLAARRWFEQNAGVKQESQIQPQRQQQQAQKVPQQQLLQQQPQQAPMAALKPPMSQQVPHNLPNPQQQQSTTYPQQHNGYHQSAHNYYHVPPPPPQSECHQPPPAPVKSRAMYAPPAAQRIVSYSNVVFEFVQSNHGDRFLFPKNGILEYRDNGCTVLVSFLILRTGEDDDAKTEQYEPITVYFKAQNPKLLEHLQKVVNPMDQVRAYMTDIFKTKKRASRVTPVYRLKRVTRDQDGSGEESEVERLPPQRRVSITPASMKGGREAVPRARKSTTPRADMPRSYAPPVRVGPRVKVIKKVRNRTSFVFAAAAAVLSVEGIKS